MISNLTDLADRYGSDKGSKKHRYTELYHMLFSPFKDQDINFLEMGLLIGGPEHGIDAARKTAGKSFTSPTELRKSPWWDNNQPTALAMSSSTSKGSYQVL